MTGRRGPRHRPPADTPARPVYALAMPPADRRCRRRRTAAALAALVAAMAAVPLSAADAPRVVDTPAGPVTLPADLGPTSRPADPEYAGLVADLLDARQKRQAAQAELQKRLKELAGDNTPAAEQDRRDLLRARRETDLRLHRLNRVFQTTWLGRSLPPDQRKEFDTLTPEERAELLDGRTAAQRLAVPLPPADVRAATLVDVVAMITREADARVVADWPALQVAGARADALVSADFGAYDRPAIDVLKQVMAAVTGGKAKVDASHPDAVLVTTEEGDKARAALGRRVLARVADVKAWQPLSAPLDPVHLTQVPVADAVFPAVRAGGPVLVDWAGLADLGVGTETPVALGLPAHRLGHRMLAIAEALEADPKVKQAGGLAFDVVGGAAVLSSPAGLRAIRSSADGLRRAAGDDKELRKALDATIQPVETVDGVLEELLTFVAETTGAAVVPDWPSLAGCGLTPKSQVTIITHEPVPAALVLPLLLRPAAGRGGVVWVVGADGKLHVAGPGVR